MKYAVLDGKGSIPRKRKAVSLRPPRRILPVLAQVQVQVRPGLLPGWMQCFFRVTGSRGWRVCLHINTIRLFLLRYSNIAAPGRLHRRVCSQANVVESESSRREARVVVA